MTPNNVGILLTNIGTPAEPSPTVVKHYLKKFLSDRRVIDIPPMLWQPILRGLILPIRSKKSAKLYQKIWTRDGSPLLVFSRNIAEKLEATLNVPVALGMHYSQPSIQHALEQLREQNCQKIIILPLYPQYSGAATGSSFDHVMNVLKTWRDIPDIRFIHDYADHPAYINAIADSLSPLSDQHLLFSFHGITQRAVDQGDPYGKRCLLTATLVSERLNLAPHRFSIAFQSRLGKAKWLQPYTDKLLQQFPQQGVTGLTVVCPGFAVDCLETLEEISIRGREQFLKAGGKQFHYVPALNDTQKHIDVLTKIIEKDML